MPKEKKPKQAGTPNPSGHTVAAPSPAIPEVVRVCPKPEEDKSALRQVSLSMEMSGPLPPPQMLKQYDEASPGAAKLILEMAKQEQDHRHAMESQALKAEEGDMKAARQQIRLGQMMGGGVSIIALCISWAMAQAGAHWPASMVGGGTVVALAVVFVLHQRPQQQDQQAKDRQAPPGGANASS